MIVGGQHGDHTDLLSCHNMREGLYQSNLRAAYCSKTHLASTWLSTFPVLKPNWFEGNKKTIYLLEIHKFLVVKE